MITDNQGKNNPIRAEGLTSFGSYSFFKLKVVVRHKNTAKSSELTLIIHKCFSILLRKVHKTHRNKPRINRGQQIHFLQDNRYLGKSECFGLF